MALPPRRRPPKRADGLQRQHLARGTTKPDQPLIRCRPVGVGEESPPADEVAGIRGANTISQALEYTPGVYSSLAAARHPGSTRHLPARLHHGGDVDNLFLDGMPDERRQQRP
ncbi:hypothetical protein LNP74_28050 [Klebsiella pneumoniae subsp. pneumoniae]|nr:hypothetical protein [Klebsiella pneumoniae subsp. pneumoniae]